MVINNSTFDGIKGFWLGRHHYDAQFYLINSHFSENMANKPIFKKTYTDILKNRANLYGSRYFFFNNLSDNNYSWTKDNFFPKKDYLKNKNIEQWVFKNKWSPKKVLKDIMNKVEAKKFSTEKFQLNR